jgi:hypothetical protein
VTANDDNKVIEETSQDDVDIPIEYTVQDADAVSEEKQAQLPVTHS